MHYRERKAFGKVVFISRKTPYRESKKAFLEINFAEIVKKD
ncbi:MAG: hypothetical protein RSB10_03735 [Clostridia bacterium]